MTTTTARAGRFAPSVLDPQLVEFIDAWDNDPEDGNSPEGLALLGYIAEFAPEAKRRGPANCTVCGAALRYVVLCSLTSTGELFVVGEDCADSIGFAAQIGGKVTDLRAKSGERRENRKRADRRAELLASDPDLAAAFDLREEDSFLSDVYAKAGDKGGLTDRQTEAVKQAARRIAERHEREAREAALPTAPVVEGRIVVTGEVVGITSRPGYAYNSPDVTKIVVRDDRGFKVYGTCPKAIELVVEKDEQGRERYNRWIERGQRVTFTATVERSSRPDEDGNLDETFGFFSHPTKAARI